MKAILIVALVALVSMVIIFAYTEEWHRPVASTTCCEPNVQLGSPDLRTSDFSEVWDIEVAGVSEAKDLASWKAILLRDGGVEDEIDPLSHGSAYLITFTDLGGEGKLTTGDFFRAICYPGSSYKLSIIWKESGNEAGSAEWET